MIDVRLTIKIVLLILLPLAQPVLPAQRAKPIYGTLGPDAPTILRALVSPEQIHPIEPRQLMQTLHSTHLDALIVPENWLDRSEFEAVLATGVSVVMVRRHTSIAYIEQNIRILANLTNQWQVGWEWSHHLEDERNRILRAWWTLKQPRVLVLSPDGYTQGLDTLITELIYTSGGLNIPAYEGIHLARLINDEQIRAFAPDVILLVNWPLGSEVGFVRNDAFSSVPAFRLHHLYRVDALGQDPTRLIAELRLLADLFHPPLL
jgi:ABC-type Fe3+-hydroxamate transport system substrate-binding protein